LINFLFIIVYSLNISAYLHLQLVFKNFKQYSIGITSRRILSVY
jgi:hypothetical protein